MNNFLFSFFYKSCFKVCLFVCFFSSFFSFSQEDIQKGESLFNANCTSCHYLGPHEKKLIGPGLDSEIFEEYTIDWLYKWIRNSSELIESGDKQAVAVWEEYNKSVMTAFPYFSDEDLDNILAYIRVGPSKEETAAVSPEETVVVKQDNSVWLYLLLFFVIANIILLVYVKNTLKLAAGVPVISFLGSSFKWLQANPTIIIFSSVVLVFSGVKGCWDGLSTVGVMQNYQPEQPIAFSHKLHAGEQGIDCNYCHGSARESKHAGIPSANVCMNCHTYINEGSISGKEEINKIYEAVGFDPNTRTYIPGYEQKPIEWVRIHNLPDLAYFNHSQHVNVAGVECQTCHGPIEEMEEVYQYSKLTMGWCINCHRETEVDVENPYYHDLHADWLDKYHGEDVTAEMIGGLECAKCHY